MEDARDKATRIIGVEGLCSLERAGLMVITAEELNALQAANEPQITPGYVWTGNRGWVIND